MAYTGINKADFSKEMIVAFSGLASAQSAMDKLVASVIYIALTDEANRGLEANELLQRLEMYRTGESAILRRYLLEYGPFVKADGKTVVLDDEVYNVKYAVKYSEARHTAEFSQASPEDYFNRAAINTYFRYAALAAKDKKDTATKSVKTKAEILVDLKAKFAKLRTAAQDADIKVNLLLDANDLTEPAKALETKPQFTDLAGIMKAMLQDADLMLPEEVATLNAALHIIESAALRKAA